MKGISKALRTAIYAALNGQITVSVNGVPTLIPVRDELAFESDDKCVILIGSITNNGDDTFSSFVSPSTFNLDIIGKTDFGITKDVVDDIANAIGLLLTPSKQSNGLGANADFQWLSLKRTNENHLPTFQGTQQLVTRKIVTYSLIVNQK